MRVVLKFAAIGLGCLGVAVGVVSWLFAQDSSSRRQPFRASSELATNSIPDHDEQAKGRDGSPGVIPTPLLEPSFERGGFDLALRYTGEIEDESSLEALRDAIQGRGTRGIAALEAELRELAAGPQSTQGARSRRAGMNRYEAGQLLLYEGRFEEADAAFADALAIGRSSGAPPLIRAHLTALRGISALRRGEVSNCVECVGSSSCIFPLAPEAVHELQDGSRAAVHFFSDYLGMRPDDLRVRWLLNLAYMTLGESERVPAEYQIPLEGFRSEADAVRFENVAAAAGLGAAGPNQSGGCIFDDFNGDSWPDLLTTSLGAEAGATLFLNRGDGTFEDRTDGSGLEEQVYALNVTRGDYDNDGALDVLLLRGAWEAPLRLSLLRNRGDGTFEDATLDAGLGEPISTMTAAWGDYDNDGLLDIFVGGEYLSPYNDAVANDPRNRSRLYHNRGDGTFEDLAAAAGVTNDRTSKGAVWGDYDDDGLLDLFVSNMGQPCRLYRNQGDGTFRDLAVELGVAGPDLAFACWFWDYDNDGRLDLFVNENKYFLAEEVAQMLGRPGERSSQPRLYRNLGPDGFRDVTAEVGLDRGVTPMGCNFGDVDNDGDLDFYLGTGGMSLEHLVPNRLFLNQGGRRFADVTAASGTGHLQKGHAIGFADYDGDGALDLFVQVGGPGPGDKGFNLLFRNPDRRHHWLQVKLVGTTTNRSAISARIRAVIEGPEGRTHSVYRTIDNNSSFGGNSLVESIGLGEASRVVELSVSWPTSRTTQTFHNLSADQAVEITEGSEVVRPLR